VVSRDDSFWQGLANEDGIGLRTLARFPPSSGSVPRTPVARWSGAELRLSARSCGRHLG
jgi:hypothetical protein